MSNSSALLSCSTLISYLKTLQGETLSDLYNHPATCLAVFRELPELAKQFVMRLFYVEQVSKGFKYTVRATIMFKF